MRLVDAVLRQGHLSEQAIVEAVLTGERPIHLDRCEICGERAREAGRWLDEVRDVGIAAADQVFPAEKLAAQQAQIMRKLEQLDEPSRVIAFPRAGERPRDTGARRVAPAWVGIAAAAGLALGIVGGQISARMGMAKPTTASAAATTTSASVAPVAAQVVAPEPARVTAPVGPSMLELDYGMEMRVPNALSQIDDVTPVLVNRVAMNLRSGS